MYNCLFACNGKILIKKQMNFIPRVGDVLTYQTIPYVVNKVSYSLEFPNFIYLKLYKIEPIHD